MSAYTTVCRSSDRAEWLEARRSGIGSSDAAAVLGASPFASPLSVYTDKLGETGEQEETEAMRWGTLLEPVVIAEFGKVTGRPVLRDGDLVRSNDHPFMLATCDASQTKERWSGVPGVLEIKTSGFGNWEDGIPRHVWVQIQHQMAVTGKTWGSVAVLLGGNRLKWADVERDDKFIAETLIPELADFWQRVQDRRPPKPDGSESAREALKALYPDDDGSTVQLPGDLIDLDREREALRLQRKDMDARLELIDQEIKAAIGGASAGVLASGVTYTHKLQHRKETVLAATSFRVLRRTEKR